MTVNKNINNKEPINLTLPIIGAILTFLTFLGQILGKGRGGFWLIPTFLGILFLFLTYGKYSKCYQVNWENRKKVKISKEFLSCIFGRNVLLYDAAMFLTFVFFIFYLKSGFFAQPDKIDYFYEAVIKESLGNTLVVVTKQNNLGVDQFVDLSLETELHYEIYRRSEIYNSLILERSIKLNSNHYDVVRGLPDGEYTINLMFYGIKIYAKENLAINKNQGQYIELLVPKYKGQVAFEIVDSTGRPIKDAFLRIFPGEKYPAIRDVHSDINGKTQSCWLHSTLFDDNCYFIDVNCPGKNGKLILDHYKFKIEFNAAYEEKTEKITINDFELGKPQVP